MAASLTRRATLLGSSTLALAPAAANATDPRFVARAFVMRDKAADNGDQPYGAIVVRNDEIVAEAPSRVVIAGDPTAHAEMEAIRAAARVLGRDLSGCLLVSSSRPCPMCEAAAYWAGVERMFHGADGSDGGAPQLCR